jgi:hypothetical protein
VDNRSITIQVRPLLKTARAKRAEGAAQAVEHMNSKCKAFSSNFSTKKIIFKLSINCYTFEKCYWEKEFYGKYICKQNEIEFYCSNIIVTLFFYISLAYTICRKGFRCDIFNYTYKVRGSNSNSLLVFLILLPSFKDNFSRFHYSIFIHMYKVL